MVAIFRVQSTNNQLNFPYFGRQLTKHAVSVVMLLCTSDIFCDRISFHRTQLLILLPERDCWNLQMNFLSLYGFRNVRAWNFLADSWRYIDSNGWQKIGGAVASFDPKPKTETYWKLHNYIFIIVKFRNENFEVQHEVRHPEFWMNKWIKV